MSEDSRLDNRQWSIVCYADGMREDAGDSRGKQTWRERESRMVAVLLLSQSSTKADKELYVLLSAQSTGKAMDALDEEWGQREPELEPHTVATPTTTAHRKRKGPWHSSTSVVQP